MSDKLKECSFCGKNENEVRNLIEGQQGCICNECVAACSVLFEQSGDDDPPASVLRHAYAIGAQAWRTANDFFAAS